MSDSPLYIDPAEVRKLKQYTSGEKILRLAWGIGAIFFRCLPRPFHGARCALLRLFGAKIGHNCTIARTAHIFYPWKVEMGDYCAIGDWVLIYNLGNVKLGNRVSISHKSHLCAGTHDITRVDFPLVRDAIVLEDEAWVCADAFIGPKVTIGFASIVGARSVVIKDVPSEIIVAGNPAKFVRPRPRPL